MIINNNKVIGDKFAYDGCHKIYIIEDKNDSDNAINYGYKIYDIKDLKKVYNDSCYLRFISNWKLTKEYVKQFQDCNFE